MKLKKILVIVLTIVLTTGCSNIVSSSTPTSTVENFLGKYQKMDSEVLRQLDLMLDTKSDYSDENKKEYKALMIKQYQNLSYKIVDEKKEDGNATIDVEIEVFDYKTAAIKANDYYQTHKDELKDETVIDYQIKQMKDVTEKAVYPITFNLTKDEDNKWKLDNISDIDRQKIHGLY